MWKDILTSAGKLKIAELPNECPFCHKSITPDIIYGLRKNDYFLDAFFNCPDKMCNKSFIGEYKQESTSSYFDFTGNVTKGAIEKQNFNDSITGLSEAFTTIYNESFFAEQEGLLEICGVGYRKALEFLIKDYLIKKEEENRELIEKKFLSKCIEDYIDDNRIKKVAKRAVWLGNDETHYVRKWEGKNLNDLKKLIELTVHWIEMELLTESFEDDMPG